MKKDKVIENLVNGACIVFCCAGMYVGGHMTAMYQHADIDESIEMFAPKGRINYGHYFIEAFKDFYRMMKAPV